MRNAKTTTTYIVHLTTESGRGSNQDYYYRTEAEAKRQAAELREWFKNIPSQKITISSHQIQTN